MRGIMKPFATTWNEYLSEYGDLCDRNLTHGLTGEQINRAQEIEQECSDANRPDFGRRLDRMTEYNKA